MGNKYNTIGTLAIHFSIPRHTALWSFYLISSESKQACVQKHIQADSNHTIKALHHWFYVLRLAEKQASNAEMIPDSIVHGANMGPTWVLPAPDGPHVGPMNLAIRGVHAMTSSWYAIFFS